MLPKTPIKSSTDTENTPLREKKFVSKKSNYTGVSLDPTDLAETEFKKIHPLIVKKIKSLKETLETIKNAFINKKSIGGRAHAQAQAQAQAQADFLENMPLFLDSFNHLAQQTNQLRDELKKLKHILDNPDVYKTEEEDEISNQRLIIQELTQFKSHIEQSHEVFKNLVNGMELVNLSSEFLRPYFGRLIRYLDIALGNVQETFDETIAYERLLTAIKLLERSVDQYPQEERKPLPLPLLNIFGKFIVPTETQTYCNSVKNKYLNFEEALRAYSALAEKETASKIFLSLGEIALKGLFDKSQRTKEIINTDPMVQKMSVANIKSMTEVINQIFSSIQAYRPKFFSSTPSSLPKLTSAPD